MIDVLSIFWFVGRRQIKVSTIGLAQCFFNLFFVRGTIYDKKIGGTVNQLKMTLHGTLYFVQY